MSRHENVMVVETEVLRGRYCLSRGLNLIGDDIFEFLLRNYRFMPRERAENDPGFKQIIPYVTVRHGSLWLLFRRKTTQTETRLHNMYSLGLGGHINDECRDSPNPIISGLYRELGEEIALTGHSAPRYLGVINDDETEVGKVHLGLLFELYAASTDFILPEAHKMSARWTDTVDLPQYRQQMETWSQFLV